MYSAVLNRVKNYSEVFGDNKIAIVGASPTAGS